MSGVAAAAAYSTQPGMGQGPGVPPSTAYPYGSSVDMEGAVEMVSALGLLVCLPAGFLALGARWAAGVRGSGCSVLARRSLRAGPDPSPAPAAAPRAPPSRPPARSWAAAWSA